jgi:hypothetical protein
MADDRTILIMHDPRRTGDKQLVVAISFTPEEEATGLSDDLVKARLWNAWQTYWRELAAHG